MKKPPTLALIIALVLGALFGVTTMLNSQPVTPAPGEMVIAVKTGAFVGEAFASVMLLGVVAWLIVYFAAVKPSGRKLGGAYFGIIIGVFTVIFAPVAFLHQFGGLSATGAPAPGDFARLGRTFDGQMDADSKNYQAELAKTSTTQFLMPPALTAPGGIARAKDLLKQQRAIVLKYQALFPQRKAEQRASLAGLKMDDAAKSSMLVHFDQGAARRKADVDEYWRLQLDVLDHEDAMVAFLARWRGAWHAQGAMMMFTRSGLLQTYQANVDAIRSDGAEIHALATKMNAETERDRRDFHQQYGD